MAVLLPSLMRIAEEGASPVARYPRMRYMGSKYRVIPALTRLFATLPFDRALDAFSGSGVVAYALKVMGKEVTANDFLAFSAAIARATVENGHHVLSRQDVDRICGPSEDHRDFIFRTFRGLYYSDNELHFLDSAWSHIDRMMHPRKDVALAALCLAAARKRPRGVFTITDQRYDDGRRHLRTPLPDLFREAVDEYNAIVFDNGRQNRAMCRDVFQVEPDGFDLVYLDPPYAPPRDDNCYIKRYHFLEGLAVYWRGQQIMEDTATKKLAKRYTPFSYKRTIRRALKDLFERFRKSAIVLSYSSNSVPGEDEILALLKAAKGHVDVYAVPHRYSFGTHSAALRTTVHEYVFVGY